MTTERMTISELEQGIVARLGEDGKATLGCFALALDYVQQWNPNWIQERKENEAHELVEMTINLFQNSLL